MNFGDRKIKALRRFVAHLGAAAAAAIMVVAVSVSSMTYANYGLGIRPSTAEFVNPAPVVSFKVFEAQNDGALVVPPKTPAISHFFDERGVYAVHVGASVARHIAEISAEASGISNNDLHIDTAIKDQPSITISENAALQWLMDHSVVLDGNAVVWHYTFDHTFDNIVIKAGWRSAFAQADVMKAFLMAFRKTSRRRYLDMALRAGYAYAVPCERGGLLCEVGGIPWFEEVPVSYGFAPMILNGHLYSVVMLAHLYRMTHDQRIRQEFAEGVASAKRMLTRFDTGYWSVYQVRPRETDIKLVFAPDVTPTEIHDIRLAEQTIRPSILGRGRTPLRTYRSSGAWADGWGTPTEWARELTGLAAVDIVPGPLLTDRDPVNLPALAIAIAFRSPNCVPPIVATYDFRAKSQGYVAIAPTRVSSGNMGCTAQYQMSTAIDQWSQVDEFYHDWHTRLVTALWEATGDAEFYATAVRWTRYKAVEQGLTTASTKNVIFAPIWSPSMSPKQDAAIMHALNGATPGKTSDAAVAQALDRWGEANHLSADEAVALKARAGLGVQKVVWPVDRRNPAQRASVPDL